MPSISKLAILYPEFIHSVRLENLLIRPGKFLLSPGFIQHYRHRVG